MKSQLSMLIVPILLLANVTASADDGEKILKEMSRNADVTVEPEEVGVPTSEAEHAFTDMMKFYVPSQAASGLVNGVEYINADGVLVETLYNAKPLINVFIHGPAIAVEDTAFSHSFMDTFAAVSLDDGVTWKTTNLSQSADQSSFQLGQASSSTSSVYEYDDGDLDGPTITEAEWEDGDGGKLKAKGKDAPPKAKVTVINAVTKEELGKDKASKSGEWEIEEKKLGEAPCSIAAVANGVEGPAFVPKGTPEECVGEPGGGGSADLTNYPGGAYNVFHATAGNKVLAAWPSRYCEQGQPAYALANDEEQQSAVVEFLQSGTTADGTFVPALGGFSLEDDLYLVDAFGVAGSQGSIDFADEDFPQAGEVPFGCVWTARGVLLAGDDPRTDDASEQSYIVWTKAERLTSGRRDPNRIEVKAVKGAGFVMTWQEDPDGLRPGDGEGPGEGWSGAVAHSKTDVWYSFINWDYFDYVEDDAGQPISIVTHDLTLSGRPQVFVPMAIPMRLTNNDKCTTDGTEVTDTDLYCSFGETGDEIVSAADFGLKDQCADIINIPTGKDGTPTPICVNEDGLPNVSNTASTRPRLSLQASEYGNAWVVVAAEESKGLGAFFFDLLGYPCEEGDENCSEEIGKNQWYFSFDMGTPDTSADMSDTGLVRNLTNQGNMLNQPEVDWRTGEFYPIVNTVEMWNFVGEADYNFDLVNTEIARRASLLAQSVAKARASQSKLLATPSWKQGPMRQGGPADTMLRRIVDPGTSTDLYANPYAFTNMVCDSWAYADGSNPYYPDGICLDPATNLSGVVADTCTDSTTGGDVPCPTVVFGGSTFGVGDTDPILQGSVQGEGNTTQVLTWHQCPSGGSQITGDDVVTCDNDNRTDDYVNLKDQSWYNPLDVSKGHRGFLDGDMVMFLYAWSPNWRLNAKGSDRYELYVRRSFDGGASWTTTPSGGLAGDGVTSFAGDGTVACETYRSNETNTEGEPHACFEYGAGVAEQARNVTQHQAMRITTLDPRYAATAASIGEDESCLDFDDPTVGYPMSCVDTDTYLPEVRDPSRYFMVYETGDNTTVEEGEAEPLSLFYSRAINFGDDYVVWADADDLSVCYPSDPHGDDVDEALIDSGFCNEFDRMNAGGDAHSSEANLESNPDGSKLYGVWAEWVIDETTEETVESDAMARRVWWLDNFVPADAWDFGSGTGDGTTAD